MFSSKGKQLTFFVKFSLFFLSIFFYFHLFISICLLLSFDFNIYLLFFLTSNLLEMKRFGNMMYFIYMYVYIYIYIYIYIPTREKASLLWGNQPDLMRNFVQNDMKEMGWTIPKNTFLTFFPFDCQEF